MRFWSLDIMCSYFQKVRQKTGWMWKKFIYMSTILSNQIGEEKNLEKGGLISIKS